MSQDLMFVDDLRRMDDRNPAARLAPPDLGRLFLMTILLVSGTVTLPQIVEFGGASGLGLWTILLAVTGWMQWIARPYFPREVAWVLMPLALFNLFVVISLGWSGPSDPAIQNLVVTVCFPAIIMVTASECERDPKLAQALHRGLDTAALIAALAYTLVALVYGRGGEAFLGTRPVFLARPFALFAMLCVARQIARWMGGEQRGLFMAVWLVALAFMSDSRTATVACLALFPIAFIVRGDRKGLAMALVFTILGVFVFAALLTYSEEFYNRFFKYDASIQVGGVAINASGRMEMWTIALENMKGDESFGKGIAAATRLIDAKFGKVGHPHNDFLRYVYEFGYLGLFLYVFFLLSTLGTALLALRRAWRIRSADMPIHMTTFLAIISLICAMMTDNPVVYVYVMAPVAIIIGCSLARLRAERASVPKGASAPWVRAESDFWRTAERFDIADTGRTERRSRSRQKMLPGPATFD